MPHPPQLLALVLVSTSHEVPSALQSAKGRVHWLTLQSEPSHLGVAWANAQTVPHFPQLVASVVRFDSQPSLYFRLQS